MPDPPVRLVRAGPLESGLTQGIYHALAREMMESSQDTIILCSPKTPYLCIGYHQVLDAVLDRKICDNKELPILRRRVGGGATYLDHNQVFYQCIFHHSRVPARADKVYQMMLEAPVQVLNQLGLDGRLRAVNEVEANSMRIAGIGGGRVGDAMVVVGNLLLDFDYQMMSQVWRASDPGFRELAATAMEDRVSTLRKLGYQHSVETLEAMLADAFKASIGRPVIDSELSREELDSAIKTAQDLSAETFLSLHRPEGEITPMKSLKIAADVFIHRLSVNFNEQQMEVSARVDQGIITDIRGDFQDFTPFKEKMVGSPLSEWK